MVWRGKGTILFCACELNLHPLFELAILQQSHATRKGQTCPRSRSPRGMTEGSKCICCQKEIFEEQDYTTLICHAAGQATSHTTPYLEFGTGKQSLFLQNVQVDILV